VKFAAEPELWGAFRMVTALMLVAARLRYMAGQTWGTQRYINMHQEISA